MVRVGHYNDNQIRTKVKYYTVVLWAMILYSLVGGNVFWPFNMQMIQ